MKAIFSTNANNWTALVARVALGITIFPHGAQKLLGWFGGYGFNGTMNFLTGGAHLPWLIALFVILIESIGALLLIAGLATRIAAFAVIVNFLGVVFTSHINNGFFMNWYSEANKGEGIEYFVLLFGLSIVSLIAGGGKWSADAVFASSQKDSKALHANYAEPLQA